MWYVVHDECQVEYYFVWFKKLNFVLYNITVYYLDVAMPYLDVTKGVG